DCSCSKGNVEDKILVPKPPKNCARCARCGHPDNGPYCQGCALLREKLEGDLVTCLKYFQDTFESFDDSTNAVNAPREPFIVKQDHGVNPPHIDECCCECGNALDGIYCQQCICKSCGKGAHTGYNFPPKVPFQQQYLCCDQRGGPHETFQCYGRVPLCVVSAFGALYRLFDSLSRGYLCGYIHLLSVPAGRPIRCVRDISELWLQEHWYMLVLVTIGDTRQVQLVDTDTESDPEEASLEAEKAQPLGSRVPLMSDEFEASEPSGTRTVSSHSLVSLDSTAPLSPDHPLTHVSPTHTPTRALFHHKTARMTVRAQPAMSLGLSASVTEAMALLDSAFRKKYRSSYETPSPSPSLLVRKRFRGLDDEGQGLDDEGQGLEDEGLGMEEVVPKVQQQAVSVVDTATSEPLGLGYRAARRCALNPSEDIAPSTYEVDPEDEKVYTDILAYPPAAPVQTSPSLEWSSGSLPISPLSLIVPSPVASPVTTPVATIMHTALPHELQEMRDRVTALEQERDHKEQ
nr:hypothetical protein [Tanacetum cinerariifolium]